MTSAIDAPERASLLATDAGGRTMWVHAGEVYIASTAAVWGRGPLPQNVRWEASEAHVRRYWADVFARGGWTLAAEVTA